MKVSEQEICEYLFDLLSTQKKAQVKSYIDSDPEVQKEYVRLKNKFDRLNLLYQEYPNPMRTLSQILIKNSAVAAVLALVFSLWFLPSQAQADTYTSTVENIHAASSIHKVCCTSGISPEKAPKFDKALDEILANNMQMTSSIDSEMNYSTHYLKKLSL